MAGRPPPRGTPPASTHTLYVLVPGASDKSANDLKSRKLTMEILGYIQSRLPTINSMGIVVSIQKVQKPFLQNSRVRDAMKAKGIRNLPALMTPAQVYLGVAEIKDLYEKNILEFQAWNRREVDAVQGADPEDALSAFHASEMSFARFNEDVSGGGDGALGEEDSSGMMDAFHQMVRRRESRDNQRTAGTRVAPLAGPGAQQGGHDRGPARPAATRVDNVDAALAGIDELIGRMAGEIDPGTLATAFSGHGGDATEDGSGTGDAQDTLMERRYWENQESSM